MSLPLPVPVRIGSYTIKRHLSGGKYPLVLMLEPLLRCNLACPGCGKIDYPDAILNKRLSYDQCMEAIEECGAPAVSIAGGEPLLHREMPRIVRAMRLQRAPAPVKDFSLLMTCATTGASDQPGSAAPGQWAKWARCAGPGQSGRGRPGGRLAHPRR